MSAAIWAHFALPGLGIALLFFSLIWLASVRLRDASIVDIFWGPGFALLAWVYAIASSGGSAVPTGDPDAALLHSIHGLTGRRLLVPILVSLWALRLGVHIFVRNRGHGEDPRYAAMRERHGKAFTWKSLFIVYWLQAVLLWVIAAPLLAIATSQRSQALTTLDWLAIAVFAIGLFFEAVGDWQLRRFKADPANRGKVLDTGLWRYTRHPNYFGDATLWWGHYLFAVAAGGAWTIFSPLLMSFLIVKVSGVALLERSLGDTKPKYAEYIRKTSSFFPWPPKS